MGVFALDADSVAAEECQKAIVTIGNFDGVHRGHVALLAQARSRAERVAAPVTVVTFDPHPVQILAPHLYHLPLTTIQERGLFLHRNGADHVVVLRTTEELLGWEANVFWERLLIRSLQIRGLVEGFNFRFGKDRRGSNALLKEWSQQQGLDFSEVTPQQWDGEIVSTSRVREKLLAGEIEAANDLLNHRYAIHGVVGSGAQRGRTIGFPTANLQDCQTVLPPNGVYAVRGYLPMGSWLGAMNIGPNPTFGETAQKIEVFLIDFSGDIYGQPMRVELLSRLRETRTFASRDALIQQMTIDVARAKTIGEEYR